MTAIAGVVWFDGRAADRAHVADMLEAVPFRGGERTHVWCGGPASLGVAWRFSSRRDRDDRLAGDDERMCVFDGRLDNREELSRTLQIDAAAMCELTDAALVLRAHARWADRCAAHLLGDFVFAVWNARSRRLLIARDPLGMRAVVFAKTPACLAFATDTAQLLELPWVDRRPNAGFFGEYLAGFPTTRHETIYAGIERLPPAHVLVISPTVTTTRRYWDIDPARTIEYDRPEEYEQEFRSLLEQSVRCRTEGVADTAILLSGGVDSSTVTAMAAALREQTGTALTALTVAFPSAPDADESHVARDVAGFCGIPISALPFEAGSPVYYLERARTFRDVLSHTAGRTELALLRSAAADGSTRLFDGSGGDEWFGGSHYHSADLLRRGRWIAALRQAKLDSELAWSGYSTRLLAASSAWAALSPRGRRAIKRLLPARDRTPRGISRSFAASIDLTDRIWTPNYDERFASRASGGLYVDATGGYGVWSFEQTTRDAAFAGLDLAPPLQDRRLAEFGMAIPEEQRWSDRLRKPLLRRAMRGLLPEAVTGRRDKAADGSAALVAELQAAREAGVFDRPAVVEEGMADRDQIRGMFDAMLAMQAARDPAYGAVAGSLWSLYLGEIVWQALFAPVRKDDRWTTPSDRKTRAAARPQPALEPSGLTVVRR